MTTLAADKFRTWGWVSDVSRNKIPVIASDIIYKGAAVGCSASASGHARPFADGDKFMGFAIARADNSSGSAADIDVEVHQEGVVQLTVVDTDSWDDYGKAVYATDDDTFSITDSGSDTQIGVIRGWVSSTTCWVHFKAAGVY